MAEEKVAEEVEETPEVEEEEATTPKEEVEEASEVEEEPKEESSDIPLRSNASYIIDRKNRQLEKLRSKADEPEESGDPAVERLDRIEQVLMSQADERELATFFEDNPDALPYKDNIRAYMEHDAYKGVAPEVIFHHLDYQNSQAKKESKRKAADFEAGQTKSAGAGARETKNKSVKTAEDIKNMSAEEFSEYDKEQQRLARA